MSNELPPAQTNSTLSSALRPWKEAVTRYQRPTLWRAVWQVLNTLGPYIVIWLFMYRSLAVSVWLALAFALLAGGFFVRIFIIFTIAPTARSSGRHGQMNSWAT